MSGPSQPGARERWDRLGELFDRLLALRPEDRPAFIAANAADGDMARELSQLLDWHEQPNTPVDRVQSGLSNAVTPTGPVAGARLGPYELEREIGRGGMGTVFLARRVDGEFAQRVALKVARASFPDEELRSRFLTERHILAGLTHPNIAALYDGGTTEDGQPYFTMEYVEGQPIDRYCDANGLDIPARLRLMLDVCRAVSVAHNALVVHRDLKPSNVLVTAVGQVKLLDFGIAKLLLADTPARVSTAATVTRRLTPAYASPEQVLGGPVSTATDVYALGLLIYELMCGRQAHQADGRAAGLVEHAVVNEDPPALREAASAAPRDGQPSLGDVARMRATTPARLRRVLGADIQRIVTKALQKEPASRYQSASALAEDVERFLEGRPVTAAPPTLTYRTSKFIRRHRFGSIAAAVALVAAGAYGIAAVKYGRDMAAAADRERRAAAQAREVSEFMVGLFAAGDPDAVQNPDARVSDLLAQGLGRVDALSGQPALQAQLLNAIGRVYFNLGRFSDARQVAERGRRMSEAAFGSRHADVAKAHRLIGLAAGMEGRRAEAVAAFRQALDIDVAAGGASTAEAATDRHELGVALVQAGRVAEGEGHLTAALAHRRALLGSDHDDVAESLSALAFTRSRQDRDHEAAALYREALELRVRRLGPLHSTVARAHQNLGTVLTRTGSIQEAESQLLQALEVFRKVLGPSHPSVATSINNIALIKARQGDHESSIAMFRQALEIRRQVLGPRHSLTLLTQTNLAATLAGMSRLAEAEALLRAVAAPQGEAQPVDPWALGQLARVLLQRGKTREAEAVARDALARERAAEPRPLREAEIIIALARALIDQRRSTEARSLVAEALTIRSGRLGDAHPDTLAARTLLESLPEARRARALPTPR